RVTIPLSARLCRLMPLTALDPPGIGTVIWPDPPSVRRPDTSSLVGLLLDTTICTPPAGDGGEMEIVIVVCRFLPTDTLGTIIPAPTTTGFTVTVALVAPILAALAVISAVPCTPP